MADDPATFTATVDKWVAEVPERLSAVFRDATQTVVETAQDAIPVDTGFARASIRASTESMPQADGTAPRPKGREPGSGPIVPYSGQEIVLEIARATIEDTIFIGWTANYAIYLEYGHSSQAPTGFVRNAALQWPRIVDESAQKAKAS